MPCMHARLQGTSPACCHIIHPFAPCNPFPSVTPKGGVLSYLLWPLCIRWHLAPVRLGASCVWRGGGPLGFKGLHRLVP